MGLFGGNQDAQERYYNLPVNVVYQGMKDTLASSKRFRLKKTDDLSCSCSFTTGVSLTTAGEKMTAAASPSGEGSKVTVTVAAKIGGNTRWQGPKNAKDISAFFDALSETLRNMIR